MCGLVGVIAPKIDHVDKAVFSQLLLIDQLRGAHATGVALAGDKGVITYKRSIRASDFLQLREYEGLMQLASSHKIMMGHNRHATAGDKIDANAHPFTHKHITLMHNGTITSKTSITGAPEWKNSYDTDSETIAFALSNQKSTTAVLESLGGSYSLVWYDESKQTLNFARNEERPMWMMRGKTALYWASEPEMLDLTLIRNGVHMRDDEFYELPTGTWVQFNINKLDKKAHHVKFTPKKTGVRQSMRRGGNNQWSKSVNNNLPVHATGPKNNPATRIEGYIHSFKGLARQNRTVFVPLWKEEGAGSKNMYGGYTRNQVTAKMYIPPEYEPRVMESINSSAFNVGFKAVVSDITRSSYKLDDDDISLIEYKVYMDNPKNALLLPKKGFSDESCNDCGTPIFEGEDVEIHKYHDSRAVFHKECFRKVN
jgi:predicted glutamine amidotransferase